MQIIALSVLLPSDCFDHTNRRRRLLYLQYKAGPVVHTVCNTYLLVRIKTVYCIIPLADVFPKESAEVSMKHPEHSRCVFYHLFRQKYQHFALAFFGVSG